MKRFFLLVCMIGCMLSMNVMAAVEKVTVKGSVRGIGNGELVLVDAERGEIARVNACADDFVINAEVETGDLRYYTLYALPVGSNNSLASSPNICFFIDAPMITVRAELNGDRMLIEEVKGSPGMDEYNRVYELLPSMEHYREAYHNYFHLRSICKDTDNNHENWARVQSAREELDVVLEQVYEEIFEALPRYSKSMAFVTQVAKFFTDRNFEQTEKFWAQLDSSVYHCYALRPVKAVLERCGACAVGHEAPDFVLPIATGEMVKLSSLRGKYVLVDFWASWCAPCRREFQDLKSVYEEYREKGLEVVGVSTDRSEEEWRRALEDEKFEYLQLYDAKDITTSLYNYFAIPFMVLISPEGIILDREVRGYNVRKKIAEYMKVGK